MHQLAPLIHSALPHLSFEVRALIDAMLLTRGSVGTAQWVASHLGLSNRYRLARRLSNEGLPPLHRLSGWMTVLSWMWERERNGVALCRSALRAGKDPAACRRLVRRITSVSWRSAQSGGIEGALAQFLCECGAAEGSVGSRTMA